MRILITGAHGQLGQDMVLAATERGFDTLACPRSALDITSAEAVNQAIETNAPDLVVNCAAYTAVDRAETQPDLAFAVNRDGPANLADACRQSEIPLIHISTDYVFDGTKKGPYVESDPVCPLNVYGQSKLAGEEEVQARTQRHLIIRTAWVFGAHGDNFVKTMLRFGCKRENLRVVDDQIGCPTYTGSLANAIAKIGARLATQPDLAWGIYHYADQPPISWHGFAVQIFDTAREAGWPLKLTNLEAIPTRKYPTPARRAANSVLDCGRIESMFGIETKRWLVGVRSVVDSYTHDL